MNVPSIARSNSRLKVGDGSAFSRNLKSPHYVGNEVQDQHIGLVPGTGEQGISPPPHPGPAVGYTCTRCACFGGTPLPALIGPE